MTKYLITAMLIVAISEVAKLSDKLGALIATLPWVTITILALIWMYIEAQPAEKLSNHALLYIRYIQ